ncbi:autotransporter assembly complex protein TamA [Roseinatronobacter alkalisoli]|uniref:BamA/TamA family outer membrane protein n=1 Tax=Roseinatronobacter alkalisoli TaxID=3028235 RepID=A0ABT5T9Q5_9RHOB|nr:BamA/TamA family outer membrane protein [Roseinatronobacter sp. HJB301]MDD7971843.1 BamA/TamA family outer membrane protein [Roseinatronobacter sp. HJB301]
MKKLQGVARSRLASVAQSLLFGLALAHPAAGFEDLRFTVTGGDSALERVLQQASLLRAARDDGLSDPFEVFTIARAEYGQLIGLFYEAGYYAPGISIRINGREAADISPLNPPANIGVIDVQLNAGPPFVFGRAQIGPLAPETELPAGFATGRSARSTIIRDTAGAAIDGWRDQGHAKAEPVRQQITARHPAQELDVDVSIDPGPRFTFGQLRPSGQERTRPNRIVKIAGLPTGEVFSPDDVQRAAERLRRTGTFASVALREAEEGNPDGSLDINAAVVEAPLRRIGASIELDTESGAKVSGFWLHRNLLGGAERLRIEAMVGGLAARRGGRDYRLALEFSRPATFTPDTTLTLGVLAENEREDDFRARRARLDIGLSHRFSDQLTFGAGVGALVEQARFGPTLAIRRNYRLLLLPLTLEWDRRDDERAPTGGTYLQADLTPFYGVGAADSGARAYVDARSYFGFGEDDRFVLAARAQAGAVLGAAIDRTPRDFLFYSGGGGSVRGQPFRSLGVSPGGVRSGGRGFAALSLEGRMRATETIGLVAFTDAGYVSEGVFSGQSGWHAGAGLGLRYDTPVGPLRLDVGMPVRGATGRGPQLYLGIGQAF